MMQIENIISIISIAIARFLNSYFNAVGKILQTDIHIKGGPDGLKISLEGPNEKSIDERILKIDTAKSNLLEGLKAIEDLSRTAKENKRELSEALVRLDEIQSKKASAESELKQIRQIAEADANSLRKIMGIPSKADVYRQQFVGFVSGVMASLIAAGLIWLGSLLLRFL
jgi:hypothetical protein